MLRIIVAELMLVLGSVFVFRSLWNLLDQCHWLNTTKGLYISLVLGIGITMVAIIQLNNCLQKKK
jgi:surface polysaccharide O-acyltransferase-like enzyme